MKQSSERDAHWEVKAAKKQLKAEGVYSNFFDETWEVEREKVSPSIQ